MSVFVPRLKCENPTVLYNPSLPAIISKMKYLFYATFDGKYSVGLGRSLSEPFIDSLQSMKIHFNDSSLFINRSLVCKSAFQLFREDIESYYKYSQYFYFVDSLGELYPVFIAVPCNHCPICIERRRDVWSYRCKCETEYHRKPVLSCVLTYDNSHLPKGANLSVRDTQLFFKRLRIFLVRKGFSNKIRYSICGEYGKDRGLLNGRPHYHLILWNMPYHEYGHLNIRDLIEFCWPYGMVRRFHVVNTTKDNAFTYQMKYLIKPDNIYLRGEKFRLGIKSNHHPDRVKPFLHNSCGRLGSIGTPLIRNFVERNDVLFKKVFNMKKRPQAIFLDPNASIKFIGNSFVLRQCFKSLSQLLPCDFRRALVEFENNVDYTDKYEYLKPFVDLFRQLLYIPSGVVLSQYKFSFTESSDIIRKFLSKNGLISPFYCQQYIKSLRSKLVFRDKFLLSSMFNDEFDLDTLSLRARSSLAYAKNLEVL